LEHRFTPHADLAAREVEGTQNQTVEELVRADGLSVTTAQVAVTYAYWPAHTVLKVRRILLPARLPALTAEWAASGASRRVLCTALAC
jgi:hypothetical protein